MIASLLSLARKNVFLGSSETCACEKVHAWNCRTWPYLKLLNGRFVVFDTETTGLSYQKGDEIISLGAVIIENGSLANINFSQLINPGRDIPAKVTELTGITNDMVAQAADFISVFEKFLDFTQGGMLVAHHGTFDLGFINHKLKKQGCNKVRPPILDTYILSQLLLSWRRSYSLDSLANYYGISLEQRHTALGDSIITGKLFLVMVEELYKRGIETTTQLFEYLRFRHLV